MSAPFQQYRSDTSYVTIVTSSTGPVNKKIYLQDGKLCKDPNAQIYEGFAKTVPANTASDLRKLIENLRQEQAIALGSLEVPNKAFQLTTKARLQPGSIARSQDFLHHACSIGWLLIDLDTKGLPPLLKDMLEGRSMLDLVFEILPELLLSEILVRPSSSAGIINPDGLEQEVTGLHIYVKVADQTQSQRLLKLMHDRCWEAGYGFFALASNGTLLERSLVDTAVHGPERLVFEAKPNVLPPLIKRHIPDEVFSGGVLKCIKEPNYEQVYHLKNEARELIKPEAQKTKRRHVEDKAVNLMTETGLSKAKASKIVRQRLEGREFSEHDILETSRNRFEKVSDFLDNAPRSVGMPCPIEGSDYGLSTAYFYPVDDHRPYPRIISFAHGNITEFTFERYRHLQGLVWLPRQ